MNYSGLETTPPNIGWELALNLDTSDGNVLAYYNWDFWQSGSALGGASSNPASALTGDFKDRNVFNATPVRQLLVVVHAEGRALGWRGWSTTGTSRRRLCDSEDQSFGHHDAIFRLVTVRTNPDPRVPATHI